MSTPRRPTLVTPDVLRTWPLPDPGSSKHDRGHVLVLGGSVGNPGAVILAGTAALRVGAGVLALGVDERTAVAVAVAVPEASVIGITFAAPGADLDPRLDGVDAVVVGPGLDDADDTFRLLEALVAGGRFDAPLVLDAFGLGVLADRPAEFRRLLPSDLVLTPNPDEARRLLGDDEAPELDDAPAVAAAVATARDATVAYQRHISTPTGEVFHVPDGDPGLGTCGSGDVLAGALGGLLARGMAPLEAACWAVYLHAASGDRLSRAIGGVGYLAREIVAELPRTLRDVSS